MKKRYIFIMVFFILLFFSFIQTTDNDQIWCYGFSYNIAHGLIPYKDFNMIIGPLYNLIFSIPILLFGNYLFIYKLFHIVFYSIIITLTYKKIGKNIIWLLLAICIQNTLGGYNVFIFVLIIFMLLIVDNDYKYKNLLLGIIIGSILMIKHNIGLTLLLIYFITSKNKLKSIMYVLIPVSISLIYLLITNSFKEYIDFCYLGMGNFISNLTIDITTLIITILILIYLIKKYIKKKEEIVLYIIASMIVIFPLIEASHLLLVFIPLTYYILVHEDNSIIKIINNCFICIGVITILIITFSNFEIDKDNNVLKYCVLKKGTNEALKNYSKYVKDIDDNLYLFIDEAYTIKLYNNETTNFYDLINTGNLGRNENKYIEMMKKTCEKNKCSFILDKGLFKKKKKGNQTSRIFKDYVVENYKYKETIPSGDKLYTSY